MWYNSMVCLFLKLELLFFSRWLCYCHVPVFCDSLPKHDTTAVFGRTLLRSVFSVMRRQLLEKFRAEKDKMPADKRTIVLTHFPRYDLVGFINYSHNKYYDYYYLMLTYAYVMFTCQYYLLAFISC